MSWFPQIGSGAIAQYPVTRSRRWRAILNQLESGEQIMLPDTTAGQIEWLLSFEGLTYEEAAGLSSLFTASQGSFGAFTFVDPLANLLGWSENLSQPNWQPGLMQIAGGVTDPLGTQRAWSVSNTTPGAQALQQTLALSGDYVACFSAYLRSNAQQAVTMQRDNLVSTVTVGPAWARESVSGTGVSGSVQSNFAIVLSAGQTIDIWGLQVEAQPCASAYKLTTTPHGVYSETYFEDDELSITSTSMGLSSCKIRLISRV